MKKSVLFSFAALAMISASLAQAAQENTTRERLRDRLRARIEGMDKAPAAPVVAGKRTFAYGKDPLQQVDFWPTRNATGPAPLVIFVHGGGWKRGDMKSVSTSWKPSHFTGAGYALAAVNYRLVPDATVEQEAADVAAAIRLLVDKARQLGVDPGRIVLMGHSAGAHLVALVGTDEQYLKAAGLGFRDLKGVIPVDGAAYDVPRQMQDGNRMMQSTYDQAFGKDPARQRALSPTLQAAAPNAPRFLILHVQRADGVAQSKALELALRQAGTPVERRDFPGSGLTGHMEINRELGNPAYAATPVVDAWLAATFAR